MREPTKRRVRLPHAGVRGAPIATRRLRPYDRPEVVPVLRDRRGRVQLGEVGRKLLGGRARDLEDDVIIAGEWVALDPAGVPSPPDPGALWLPACPPENSPAPPARGW